MSKSPTPEEVQDRRARIDRLLQVFRDAQRSHIEEWHQNHEVPRRLYHYTTMRGLVGITSSSRIWASDARFMNDASELTYAADLISEAVNQVLEDVANEELREVLPRRPGFANRFEYGVQPFIACFCEEGDLLSQWRSYGRGDAPVALGFDLPMLARAGGLPPNTYLRRVIYDETEQRKRVEEAVRTWLETAERLLRPNGEDVDTAELFPYPAIWALQEALTEHHLCYKNPAFSEEREWRLIKLVNVREELGLLQDQRMEEMLAATRQRMPEVGVEMPEVPNFRMARDAEGVDIYFRESAMGLVPYVELPLINRAGVFTGRLPLWEVVQGPTTDPELSAASLGVYLESRGYGPTDLRSSGIPLRP